MTRRPESIEQNGNQPIMTEMGSRPDSAANAGLPIPTEMDDNQLNEATIIALSKFFNYAELLPQQNVERFFSDYEVVLALVEELMARQQVARDAGQEAQPPDTHIDLFDSLITPPQAERISISHLTLLELIINNIAEKGFDIMFFSENMAPLIRNYSIDTLIGYFRYKLEELQSMTEGDEVKGHWEWQKKEALQKIVSVLEDLKSLAVTS